MAHITADELFRWVEADLAPTGPPGRGWPGFRLPVEECLREQREAEAPA